jgi:hypothetical protein
MNLLDYSNKQFKFDISKLFLEKPNIIELTHDIRLDNKTVFFGGQNWFNYKIDTEHINKENLKYFCICLFTMVCADETMYTYHNQYYNHFRKKFNYPKFGWTGYGSHFEKPFHLLNTPILNGVNFNKITNEEIEEFVNNQISITTKELPSEINVKTFYTNMLRDFDFNIEIIFAKKLQDVIMEKLDIKLT